MLMDFKEMWDEYLSLLYNKVMKLSMIFDVSDVVMLRAYDFYIWQSFIHWH